MQAGLGPVYLLFVTPLFQSESDCAHTLHSLPLFAAPTAATGPEPLLSHSFQMAHFACQYVCMSCAERVANGETTYYSSNRGAQSHLGRSVACHKEGKGTSIRRIMLQHKSTDHEPGGSGTAGPWPPSHVSVVNPYHIYIHIIKSAFCDTYDELRQKAQFAIV